MNEQVTITIDKRDLNVLGMAVNRFWTKNYEDSKKDNSKLGQLFCTSTMEKCERLGKIIEVEKN